MRPQPIVLTDHSLDVDGRTYPLAEIAAIKVARTRHPRSGMLDGIVIFLVANGICYFLLARPDPSDVVGSIITFSFPIIIFLVPAAILYQMRRRLPPWAVVQVRMAGKWTRILADDLDTIQPLGDAIQAAIAAKKPDGP
jgi:hypothetical protein